MLIKYNWFILMKQIQKVAGAIKARPPIKWVGGKGRLLGQLRYFYPKIFRDYYEPFVGGAAVFFDLYNSQRLKGRAYLNDINSSLVATYGSIKKEPLQLIKKLARIERKYKELNFQAKKDFYYRIRTEYNKKNLSTLDSAAYLIFLNRTGYNGMYRENSRGEFNIPHGRYENPRILDKNNILAVSLALGKTEISFDSFEKVAFKAKEGDFIYFDPPYDPVSATAHFTTYTENKFSRKEHELLAEIFNELTKKNCLIMLSNSDTDFIRTIYSKIPRVSFFNIEAIRAINSKGNGRGKVTELVILNYRP